MITSREHYAKTYNVFKERARQHERNVKIFHNHLPSMIQKAINSFDIKRRSQFNILSVGGGTGELDMEIVNTTKQELQNNQEWNHINIFNRSIEPNENSRQLYKNATAQLDDLHTSFEIRPQTFQEYQANRKEGIKFDIVHFVHSLYYVDFEETVLHCFENELAEKGYFVSVMDDECLTHWVLKKQQHHLSLCNESFYENYQNEDSWDKSRRLTKIAEKHGFKHEMHSQEYLIEVSDLFDKESVEGNLILDFLTHTENFRKVADTELVEETLALIERLTIVKEGKRYGKATESLVLIHK